MSPFRLFLLVVLCGLLSCQAGGRRSPVTPQPLGISDASGQGYGAVGVKVNIGSRRIRKEVAPPAGGLRTQAVDTGQIDFLDISVSGPGIVPHPRLSKLNIPVNGTSISVHFDEVPAGKNRIIRVVAKDSNGNVLKEVQGIGTVSTGQTSSLSIDRSTAPVARIIMALMEQNDSQCASNIDDVALKAYVQSLTSQFGIPSEMVNADAIAQSIIQGACQVPLSPLSSHVLQHGHVNVTVEDNNQNPINNATVFLNDPTSPVLISGVNGLYEIDNVMPTGHGGITSWLVTAIAPDGQMATQSVTVPENGTTSTTLTLASPGSLYIDPPSVTMRGIEGLQLTVRNGGPTGAFIPSHLLGWVSSNPTVALVGDQTITANNPFGDKGMVLSQSDGTTRITGTIGSLSAFCDVTVSLVKAQEAALVQLAPEGIMILPTAAINLSYTGATYQLVVTEKDFPSSNYYWTSSAPDYVSVTPNGLIEAHQVSDDPVTISVTSSTGRKASKGITTSGELFNGAQVPVFEATTYSLSWKSLPSTNTSGTLAPGLEASNASQDPLGAYFSQENATARLEAADFLDVQADFHWFTSDPNIIALDGPTVAPFITLRSVGRGTATITATRPNGQALSASIRVILSDTFGRSDVPTFDAPTFGLTLGNLVGILNAVGATATLAANDSYDLNPVFRWFTSNPDVVQIDTVSADTRTATLRETGAGTATITAVSASGQTLTKNVTATESLTSGRAQIDATQALEVQIRRTVPTTPAEVLFTDGVTLATLGDTVTLQASDPQDLSGDYAWISEDPAIAQIVSVSGTANGTAVIRAVTNGTVVIQARNRNNNRFGRKSITVNQGTGTVEVRATI